MSYFRRVKYLVLGSVAILVIAAAAQSAIFAQDEPEQAMNVEAAMWSDTVVWHTTPSTVVRVEMREGDTVRGRSPQRVSDDTGRVEMPLRPAFGGGGPGGPGGPGGGGFGPVGVTPGLDLVLMPEGADEVKVTIPNLAAGIDIANDTVIGTAPAGGQLLVQLIEGPGVTSPVTQTAMAGGDGSYSVDLSGLADAQPGHAGGVSWTDEFDNTFHAFFAALTVDVTIGTRQVSGIASPGDTVAISLAAEDGTAKGSSSTQLIGDYEYALPQGFQGQQQFGPVSVGDEISVTQVSAIPGATLTVSGRIDAIMIDNVSPPDRLVQGTAAAGASVEVEAFSPFDGAVFSASTVADDSGMFLVELPGANGMGPGWRLRATHHVAPGLRVRAVESIEQVRVGVHQQVVQGVADPGSTITVTLRAQDGTEKAVDSDNVGNNGNFGVAFTGPNGLQIGDRVEVAFVAGDPVIVNVEAISARTNHQADRITGEAPNGAQVILTQGNGGNQVQVTAPVKIDGSYEATFSGVRDIEPPMNGQMVARLLSGHELFTTWAAVRMTTELGDAFLSGNGPPNRDVAVQLVDADGTTVVASGTDSVGGGGGGGFGPGGGFGGGGGGGNWFIQFADDAGDPVDVRAFDIIRATVGDDVFDITVPQLRGVAFVQDDLINGETTGARDVDVSIFRPLLSDTAEMTVTSDDTGSFAADFAENFDLQYNDVLTFSTREQDHNINSQNFVPGLRLNLDSGELAGSWRPNQQVIVQLRDPAGGSRFQTITTTDAEAVFNVTFEENGRRLLPNEGDMVRMQPVGAGEALELIIPELEVNMDKETDAVSGRTEPGGHLELFITNLYQRAPQGGGGPGGGGGGGGFANLEPEINPDGTWTAVFENPYDVIPGTSITTAYRVPVGHIVFQQRFEPMLNVQLGGANACGVVHEPRAAASAALSSAGSVLASASGNAGFNSQFSFLMRNTAGEAALSVAGQTVNGVMGDENAAITLPDFTINVNWQTGQMQGTGPAGAIGTIKWPAGDCLNPGGPTRFFQVNQQGTFQTFIQGGLRQPGDGFEIAFFTDDGHRVYRQIFRSLGQVYVHTNHVVGRAIAGQPVVVTVVDGAGATKGTATTVANTDGRFGVRVMTGGGAAVTILPGDTVRIEASGETAEVPVEELNFDWSPGNDIAGQADPNQDVEIVMQLDDGRIIDVDRTAGSDGRVRYGASDVPPRATWSMADVVGVRMIITLNSQHQILAEAGDVSSISLDPPVDIEDPAEDGTIYMPYATR